MLNTGCKICTCSMTSAGEAGYRWPFAFFLCVDWRKVSFTERERKAWL